MSSNNYMHVNPNFKSNQQQTSRTMYMNPKFYSHLNFNGRNQMQIVHINPKFIKPTITPIIANHSTNYYETLQEQPSTSTGDVTTKSRYSIVRANSNTNAGKILDTNIQKNTVSVNRYKSIPICDVNKTQEKKPLVDCTKRKINRHYEVKCLNKSVNTKTSDYHYKSDNLTKIKSNRNKYSRNSKRISPKNVLCTSNGMNMIKDKKSFKRVTERSQLKKNNIPCPLFRKYGKCLRKETACCTYVHDRKQVSICRKFLRGLCHDKGCLLSHDPNSNKMPTCHFFLKGACTTKDCPYLHVKLNDNARVCNNFLKGFCENGEKCLKRHVNLCPNIAEKGKCSIKSCPYPHFEVCKRVTKQYKQKEITKKKCINVNEDKDQNTTDETAPAQRYYKEDSIQSAASEILKPSRCKIGSLPSFIKL